jgi:excinuclease ABC subunit C
MVTKDSLSSLSSSPGVYIYKNSKGKVIYVGKAVNLSKRVKQYFQREDALGEKTPLLVSEISTIETIETESEFDAILLEAKLIKLYQPKFNVIAKDDKSPLYIAMTIKEELPRVYFARKPKKKNEIVTQKDNKNNALSSVLYFGPFQSARTARNLLRSLRYVVPYCTQKRRNGTKCFYTHLGLCNPCPSYIVKHHDKDAKKKYRKNMFRLRDILSGKATSVIATMEKEMKELAKAEQFEEAASLRNQIQALKSILTKRYDPAVYVQSDSMVDEIFQREIQELSTVLKPYYPHIQGLSRIECFDISNTMGTHASASMVVATNGRIDKNEYRKFKIKRENTPNDVAMMAEALKRRFTHKEWKLPDLIVIDGGKSQVSVAKRTLSQMNDQICPIPIIGLAKREEEIIVPLNEGWKILRLPFSNEGLKLLQRLRDEAHRFAITYHKLLRSKYLI